MLGPRNSVPIIGVVCFAVLISCSEPGDTSRESLKEALDEAYRAGDYDELVRLSLPLAERGDPEYEFQVGLFMVYGGYGEHVPQEQRRQEGLMWVRKAAEAGVVPALDTLSLLYHFGYVLPKDQDVSECYRQATKVPSHRGVCRQMEIVRGYVNDP